MVYCGAFLKKTVAWFLPYSVPSCLDRMNLKVFELGLLLPKVGSDLAHLARRRISLFPIRAFSYRAYLHCPPSPTSLNAFSYNAYFHSSFSRTAHIIILSHSPTAIVTIFESNYKLWECSLLLSISRPGIIV